MQLTHLVDMYAFHRCVNYTKYCADVHGKHEIEKDSRFPTKIAHNETFRGEHEVWFWNESTQTNLHTATHMIIVNCYSMFHIRE